ncbi:MULTISPECIES: hypothetical protein [Actinomadura]|uniref:hypothetical protein n=1 Tax=Actinomadura TaxID=1988 RepID=UPI0011601EC0|nr:hypothetical protein [Actinomadura madurae]
MTGRHRGQPKDVAAEGEVDAGASRGRRVAVVVAVCAVPVLVASVVAFGLRDGPVRERPETAGTPAGDVRTTPQGEPTFGTYVPPESEPQAATKPPKRAPAPVVRPRRTAKPTPSPTPTRARRPCPAGWEDVWWMRRWCERQGHGGR